MSDSRVFLLDGMALIYRAHFALMRAPMFNSRRENTSALFGVTRLLLDLLRDEKPSHLALVLDTSAPTFRHEWFPAYKAQRDAMPEDIALAIPAIERLAAALNIPVIKMDGYEADDLIGTLAIRAAKEGLHVMMVTPDKDYAQLVGPHIRIMKPSKQGAPPEILGPEEVCAHWNVTDPARVADVLALWGDASDNIPGVPGIGEKTAKKLIGEYGSVENIIAHASELKGKLRENVEANVEVARLALRLVTIACDAPISFSLDDLRVSSPDETALRSFFAHYEFNALGKQALGDGFKATPNAAPSASSPPRAFSAQLELFTDEPSEPSVTQTGHGTPPPEAPSELLHLADIDHTYLIAQTGQEIDDLIAVLKGAVVFAFDTETEGLDVTTTPLVGLSFSWAEGQAAYVPVPPDASALLARFAPIFSSPELTLIGHNLKFDLSVLRWHGITVACRIIDTLVAHVLLEPEQRHGMDRLAARFLRYEPIPITALIGDKKAPSRTMRQVPVEQAAEYAAEDADVTLRLWKHFQPLLAESGQEPVFHRIEMPLLPVLVEMEFQGVALDTSALREMSTQLGEEAAGLKERICSLAGVDFNLQSPKQLGEVLFDHLRLLEKPKKTATGQYATGEEILSELAPHHEIVRLILDYREITKLKSTYVDALPLTIHPRTGRVHTTYSQTAAATGRLSSNDPNLQNIPIRSERGQEIRKAFVPRAPGRVLISADYSQIELRVMASLSGDPGMKEAFVQGLDIHTATAARVFHVPLEFVTSEMRRKAKMVNFGIIYGISAFGLSQRLGVSRQEAATIIDAYFRQYPGVRAFMDRTTSECRRSGHVETLSGRRRRIPDIDSRNATLRAAAERVAINSPIQGTAADMIKLAMIRVASELPTAFPDAHMILQVHDEIIVDAPADHAPAIINLLSTLMSNALPLDVPILVDARSGTNWLQAH